MELYVLDQNFEKIYVLDTFESLIWVDKMYEPGTFELYTPVSSDILLYLRPGNYLMNNDSDRLMIIEDFTIDSDVETGNHVKIIGRDLTSILDRRIIWKTIEFKSEDKKGVKIQEIIKELITKNIISPTTATGGNARKINNFLFKELTGDTELDKMKMTIQYNIGDNLLAIIQDICQTKKIGFKITLDANYNFVFELFRGVDRSYMQSTLPCVAFKPSYGNIIESTYLEENSTHKNVALVAGEGEGEERKTRVVGAMSIAAGIFRKETFIDGSDISSDDLESGKSYVQALDERGKKELKNLKINKKFEGKCDTTRLYVYGRDFFIGDIVQVANEYGIEDSCYITEFTWSYNDNGNDAYPTFVSTHDGVSDETESSDVSDDDYFTYLEQTKYLNTSNTTKFTFTSSNIHQNSQIDIYDSIYGFNPTSVTTTEGQIEIIFPKYSSAQALTVRVYIK